MHRGGKEPSSAWSRVSQGTLLYIALHCLTRYIALHCFTLSYIVSQGTLLYIALHCLKLSHKVHCFTLSQIVLHCLTRYIALHCLTRYIALHCLTLSYKVHCFTSAFSLTHNIYLRRPSWPWFIDTFSGNLYWSWCSYWGWLLWPCGMSWVKISTSNDISLLQELLSELNIIIMFVSMIPIVIPMIWL